MIASDVIMPTAGGGARNVLDDTAKNLWSDDVLMLYLSAGQNDALNRIPELGRQSDDSMLAVFPAVTALTDTLSLPDIWKDALIHYVCFRAFNENMTAERNQARAAFHQAQYERWFSLRA